MASHRDGIRKRCGCGKRSWAKCRHPWWFGFNWDRGDGRGSREYRFSLHKVLDKPSSYVMSHSEALRWRDHYRTAIRNGTFTDPSEPQTPLPPPERLTFNDLADRYLRDYVRTPSRRPQGLKTMELHGPRCAGLRYRAPAVG